MTIDIALFLVTVSFIGFAAWRVMRRQPPVAVQEEAPPIPLRRAPEHFALPPVTIETLPIKFANMAPPIDHNVLAALVASGSRSVPGSRPAPVPPENQFARGTSPGYGYSVAASPASDLDDAETLSPASDLDDDAQTRANLSPVR
jgi:hypothetical protein